MVSNGDWGEIIDEAETERFVGREQELNIFQSQITLPRPRYLIFYITGQGGVGKTTLLNRYRKLARSLDYLLMDCTEHHGNVVAILGRFAQQMSEQHFPLKHFDKAFKTYLQKIQEIENDIEAPPSFLPLFGRSMVRASYIGGDLVPGLRKGLEYLPQEPIESRASEWGSYLAKKLTNKEELLLVRDPVSILSALFFQDLNEVVRHYRVLICFENFEETRQELQEWILRLREYKPSQSIRIVIASRDLPGQKWEPLQYITMTINLDIFTDQEAQRVLDAYNITDVKRRTEILEYSGRLPVLMAWLAAPQGQSSDSSLPTNDIVERFLRWVNEPRLRQVALVLAIPRFFNIDILKLLLEKSNLNINEQAAFDWLQSMPFVKQAVDGWQYHYVVRRMMLRYQLQKSPHAYRKMHTELADYYLNICREQGFLEREGQWKGGQWEKNGLAYVYHQLIADPDKHWWEIISLFVVTLRKHPDFAVAMMELLNLGDVLEELSDEQHTITQMFNRQLYAINTHNLQDGFELFDTLCGMNRLSSQAKGYSFAYRGECYQLTGKWEKARSDFTNALRYLPQSAEIMISRSLTEGLVGHYEEALRDFDLAIEVDKTNVWAIANRGVTYRLMGRYQEALEDFNKAISLIASGVAQEIIANRGLVYRLMGCFQEALNDFNQAIELGKQDAWIYGRRSVTYRLMGRLEEALEDASRCITLADSNGWFWYRRALIYRSLGQMSAYENDLQTAIERARATLQSTPDDWRVGFQLALYNLVAGNSADAEAGYHNLSQISTLSDLRVAVENLNEFLMIYHSNKLAQSIYKSLQIRIVELT